MIGPFSKEKRDAKLEQAIRKEMEVGLYHRALPFFLERGRYEEAGDIEANRGRIEEAAKLYERGKAWKKAAEMYLALGQVDAASVSLAKGDLTHDAARLMEKHDRHLEAARLYLDKGDKLSAAKAFEAAGDLERASDFYRSSGARGAALRVSALQAQNEHRWGDAAEIYEQAGELETAAMAWERAGEPTKAAMLRAQFGEFEGAVSVLMAHGDFTKAAELLASKGEFRRAAEAAFKGGNVDVAAKHLEELGDYVTMAKVYLVHDRRQEAKAALQRVAETNEAYESARSKLVSLHIEDLNTEAAAEFLKELIARRMAQSGPFDDQLRSWIVKRVELLKDHGNDGEALRCFDDLHASGLMNERLVREQQKLGLSIYGSSYRRPQATPAGATTAAPVPQTPSKLPSNDRYTVKERIGQGGNGAIYLATDTVLGRDVVIKMILNNHLPDELTKRWFFREAQVAARLNHANIVTVYDLAEMNGQPYIAMEYVEGQTLADILERTGPLCPERTLPILRQLIDALQYAHDAGVVHRDIKPENVMMTKSGTLKLMDFGLAKAVRGGSQTMVIAGTPAYMSPEQILGQKIDHRTDIYAIGVLLFRMLTGKLPYEGDNVLRDHQSAPIPDPRDVVPSIPAGFETLFQYAMAKNRDRRYSKVSELLTDFERLLQSRS